MSQDGSTLVTYGTTRARAKTLLLRRQFDNMGGANNIRIGLQRPRCDCGSQPPESISIDSNRPSTTDRARPCGKMAGNQSQESRIVFVSRRIRPTAACLAYQIETTQLKGGVIGSFLPLHPVQASLSTDTGNWNRAFFNHQFGQWSLIGGRIKN